VPTAGEKKRAHFTVPESLVAETYGYPT
jgi:hypothetical protein